ncbi:hypothetical protein, partial [uncultured Ruegeria sp.]|uniref:hypothetical protein n=1 Tax=uncultured Ruegeria sp. TaxID=259304 RepID=UPI00263238E3
RASVACLPFVVLRFLNIAVDQFSWGNSGSEPDTDEGRKLDEFLKAVERYEESSSHKEQPVPA